MPDTGLKATVSIRVLDENHCSDNCAFLQSDRPDGYSEYGVSSYICLLFDGKRLTNSPEGLICRCAKCKQNAK